MNTKERAELELKDLQEKLGKLQVFRTTENYNSLSENARELLIKQEYVMAQYIGILIARLENWNI